MNGRIVSIVMLALSLTGCATCEKHATACWVATGIAAGCIAASTDHRMPSDHIPSPGVTCNGSNCQ